jgi:hypothetical protein
MKLPYSEEIASLRAQIDAGNQAQILAQRARTDRMAIDILEAQDQDGMPTPDELPGEATLDDLARAFRGLSELRALERGVTEKRARLAARRQQLQLALDHLEPVLTNLEQLGAEMHELQHKQHHALHEPEWADAVAELKELADARDAFQQQIQPIQIRINYVEPVRSMLLQFHPTLQQELVAAARTDDPNGLVAWRAATMARQMLLALVEVSNSVGVPIQPPHEPMLPDTPHERHRRRLRDEAGAILEWMVQLSKALDRHARVLEEQLQGLEAEHARYEALLRERMG